MTVKKIFTLVPFYLVVFSYPLLVHFKIIINNTVPVALMLVLIVFAAKIRYWRTAFLMLAMLGFSLQVFTSGQAHDLYFMPPIAINFFVGMIFLDGLRMNQRPLIEKYIELIEGEVQPAERQYARAVTLAWVVVLFALMMESIVLALFFSHEIWSLFTNFLNYLILVSMFVIEYMVRLRVFPDKQHMSFKEYILRLSRIKLKSMVM